MLNKKGFLLIESILVMSVLLVGMILLYSNYNKIILNYGKVSYYDNVEDLYTAYYTYINKDAIGYNNENVKIIDLVNQPNEVLNNLDIEKIYYFKKEAIEKIFASVNGSDETTENDYPNYNLDWYDGTTINYLLSIKNKSAIDSCKEDNEPCLTVVKINRDGYYYFAKYEAYNVKPTANKTPPKTEEETTDPVSYSFETDSWSTIANNIKNDKSDIYKVGDTKEVKIGGTNYTVRVVNNSTPKECNGENFSQTACGFVVEFVDILENRAMNSTNTNVGGWPATDIRTYANEDFFNKLPIELQNVIIKTKVISGHGNRSGEPNFISLDKIFLFSTKEIGVTSDFETTQDVTRQLDYYAGKGVSTSNYSDAIKKYGVSNATWMLRTAASNTNNAFLNINNEGFKGYASANASIGFSPAFRIGDTSQNIEKTEEGFGYTGGMQTFTAPIDGIYQIEAWGAKGGGSTGGNGAYTKGEIVLSKGKTLYLYVGGAGDSNGNGGFNGGGNAGSLTANNDGGGGATDIRIKDTLIDRIMVAAGGGGANANGSNTGGIGIKGGAGGGITGIDGTSTISGMSGKGASQTSGGAAGKTTRAPGSDGKFGYGGVGVLTVNKTTPQSSGSGGGGGYYGGGSGEACQHDCGGSAGGGSSFISGHTGCNAVDSSGTHINNSIHYSNYYFTNTVMIDGTGRSWTTTAGTTTLMPNYNGGYFSTGTGNNGNGYIKITLRD